MRVAGWPPGRGLTRDPLQEHGRGLCCGRTSPTPGEGGGVCRDLFPSQPQGLGTRKLSLVGPESLVLRAGQSKPGR